MQYGFQMTLPGLTRREQSTLCDTPPHHSWQDVQFTRQDAAQQVVKPTQTRGWQSAAE